MHTQEIYFIAEDATGPFRKVVQLVLVDGRILSFEEERDCKGLLCWLLAEAPQIASEVKSLLDDEDERNFEVLVYNNT